MIGQTALACGIIAVGSCNGDVNLHLIQTLLERTEPQRKDTHCRFLALGMGLTYLGNRVMYSSFHISGSYFLIYILKSMNHNIQ